MANALKTYNTVTDASIKSLDTVLRADMKSWNGADVASGPQSLDLEASSSQYAHISDAAQTGLALTGDLTIESLVRLESAPSDSNYYIASKWVSAGDNRSYLFRYKDTSGTKTLEFFVSSDGSSLNSESLIATVAALTPGTDYHIAVSWDASLSTAKFYIDGSQVGGDQVGAITSSFDSTAAFNVGSSNAAGSFYDGLLAELRVWDDIRTGTEIDDNKNSVAVGNEANLQGCWHFNGVYTDATANGNDLTAVNAPVFSTESLFS